MSSFAPDLAAAVTATRARGPIEVPPLPPLAPDQITPELIGQLAEARHDEVESFAAVAKVFKPMFATFTGGEPTLRRDLETELPCRVEKLFEDPFVVGEWLVLQDAGVRAGVAR